MVIDGNCLLVIECVLWLTTRGSGDFNSSNCAILSIGTTKLRITKQVNNKFDFKSRRHLRYLFVPPNYHMLAFVCVFFLSMMVDPAGTDIRENVPAILRILDYRVAATYRIFIVHDRKHSTDKHYTWHHSRPRSALRGIVSLGKFDHWTSEARLTVEWRELNQ